MISKTVNMPAKREVSLFHSGADTTPKIREGEEGDGEYDIQPKCACIYLLTI